MAEKIIELEIRSEIQVNEYENIKKNLEKIGIPYSHTKRLSVMFFGAIGTKKIDIRVRITNKESEIVIKSGAFGSYDRVEISQKISNDQFLGIVRIFSQLNFKMEVGERETFNFMLSGGITASLVSAGSIKYLEIEKMSSVRDVSKNNIKLKKIATQLKLEILTENDFDLLCTRLAEAVDWPFHGEKVQYTKLSKLLQTYF